jgi:hypothetical protein
MPLPIQAVDRSGGPYVTVACRDAVVRSYASCPPHSDGSSPPAQRAGPQSALTSAAVWGVVAWRTGEVPITAGSLT